MNVDGWWDWILLYFLTWPLVSCIFKVFNATDKEHKIAAYVALGVTTFILFAAYMAGAWS